MAYNIKKLSKKVNIIFMIFTLLFISQPLLADDEAPSKAWTYVGTEGDYISFSGETKRIAYGKDLKWSYGTFTDGVDCSNDVFGDPYKGQKKKCYCPQSGIPLPDQRYSSWEGLTSDYIYEDKKAEYDAFVVLSPGHDKIKKPVLVVEGFDALNMTTFEEIFVLLSKGPNLASMLFNEGYDLVIMNYHDGGDYIQRNGLAVASLIKKINQEIADGNEQLIVIGASMGGLTSRYALSFLEHEGIDHNTKLFISFDAPHEGVNIPLGVQYWLNFFAPENEKAREKGKKQIDSTAARQMLIYHYDSDGEVDMDSHKIELQNDLLALGDYPQNLRKVAISNGSGITDAVQQGNNSLKMDKGSKIIDWYRNNWPWVEVQGDAYALHDGLIFEGLIRRFKSSWPFWEENSEKKYAPSSVTQFYDHAPGSYSYTMKEIEEVDVSSVQGQNLGDIKTNYPKHCFVPTKSAIGITGNAFDIILDEEGNVIPEIANISPFDEIHVEKTNTEHISVTDEIADFIMNEIEKQSYICNPPNYGDWTVDDSCTMEESAIIHGNVLVKNGAVLTIPDEVALNMDLNNYHIKVEKGSGVLIKNGGRID